MTNPDDPAFRIDITTTSVPKTINATREEFEKSLQDIRDMHNGLTKREWFAGMAMQGFLSSDHWVKLWPKEHYNWAGISEVALSVADHLIAELNKTEEKK